MEIRYERFSRAWDDYSTVLEELASSPNARKICEVGGGANPFFSLDFVDRQQLDYAILDISAEELKKAPDGYRKLQGDVGSPKFDLPGQYDLIFSMQLAEHIENGIDFHKNIHGLLKKGAYAFHFFPTLYAPPFILNRFLPSSLSGNLLLWHSPDRVKEGNRGKFPAYYSWCLGPVKSQIDRLENLGYEVERYVGFFGHDYYQKWKPFHALSNLTASILLNYPVPILTSYAYVLLRKK
ncbi:methyltransferase domain-containing protein [Pannus brasiliensis CCIBt3594]|uniref:Methyltransferase domain-containing protein n=1 Tax=Pannus brasiliensis CCIBt3594 TaxID=1427578 RepID=A0AAW9QLC7_9CHRO